MRPARPPRPLPARPRAPVVEDQAQLMVTGMAGARRLIKESFLRAPGCPSAHDAPCMARGTDAESDDPGERVRAFENIVIEAIEQADPETGRRIRQALYRLERER